MFLVIWGLRFELDLQEICVLALTYMFGAIVYLLNNGYAQQYAVAEQNTVCVLPLVEGGVYVRFPMQFCAVEPNIVMYFYSSYSKFIYSDHFIFCVEGTGAV